MDSYPSTTQRGFTLAEVLTTLAVVGIGLSLATPGLEALNSSNQQAVSVNQLVSTMHLARSEAITRNARVTVCTSRDGLICDSHRWDEGWIAFLDGNADVHRDPGETVIDQVPSLPGVQLRSAEFEHAFSYRPNGRVVGAESDEVTGEFSFCDAGATVAARVVVVRASGLPALSATRQDGSPARCRDI